MSNIFQVRQESLVLLPPLNYYYKNVDSFQQPKKKVSITDVWFPILLRPSIHHCPDPSSISVLYPDHHCHTSLCSSLRASCSLSFRKFLHTYLGICAQDSTTSQSTIYFQKKSNIYFTYKRFPFTFRTQEGQTQGIWLFR